MPYHISRRGRNAGRPSHCPARIQCTLLQADGSPVPHFETEQAGLDYIAQRAKQEAEQSGTGTVSTSRKKRRTDSESTTNKPSVLTVAENPQTYFTAPTLDSVTQSADEDSRQRYSDQHNRAMFAAEEADRDKNTPIHSVSEIYDNLSENAGRKFHVGNGVWMQACACGKTFAARGMKNRSYAYQEHVVRCPSAKNNADNFEKLRTASIDPDTQRHLMLHPKVADDLTREVARVERNAVPQDFVDAAEEMENNVLGDIPGIHLNEYGFEPDKEWGYAQRDGQGVRVPLVASNYDRPTKQQSFEKGCRMGLTTINARIYSEAIEKLYEGCVEVDGKIGKPKGRTSNRFEAMMNAIDSAEEKYAEWSHSASEDWVNPSKRKFGIA